MACSSCKWKQHTYYYLVLEKLENPTHISSIISQLSLSVQSSISVLTEVQFLRQQSEAGIFGSKSPCRSAVSRGWGAHAQSPCQSSRSKAQSPAPLRPASAAEAPTLWTSSGRKYEDHCLPWTVKVPSCVRVSFQPFDRIPLHIWKDFQLCWIYYRFYHLMVCVDLFYRFRLAMSCHCSSSLLSFTSILQRYSFSVFFE